MSNLQENLLRRPFERLSPQMKAVVLVLISTLGFTLMNVLIRDVSKDLHAFQIVFLRNLFALLIMLPWILRHLGGPQGSAVFTLKKPRLMALRLCLGVTGMYTWFASLTLLPLAEAVALNFTVPLFATAGAALFLGEIVRARRWSATLVGFLGVLIILRPGFVTLELSMLLPIIAALFMAGAVICVKLLSRHDTPMTLVLWMNLALTPMTLVPALLYWQWPSWQVWVAAMIIGFAGTGAHLLKTRAYGMAEASFLLPLDYLSLPLIAGAAFALYGEVPDFWTWIGAGVIAVSTLYIARREALVARQRVASGVASHSPVGKYG